MAAATGDIDDRADLVRARFDRHVADRVRGLITEALVREHAAAPLGPHSDDLARVLTFLRRAPVEGKHIVLTVAPDRRFRIGRIGRADRTRPLVLQDGEYPTYLEAFHAIFLQRVAALRAEHEGPADG